jgi:putative transposase
MDKRWISSKHAVYNCAYHLLWCPKYRRDVLKGDVAIRLKELLLEKAESHDWIIENLEIMPDHVHVFIKATTVDAPVYIVSQLKGYSSRVLRNEFKELRTRIPTLWTRSYYVETIGHISEKTIKKYIDEQKKK